MTTIKGPGQLPPSPPGTAPAQADSVRAVSGSPAGATQATGADAASATRAPEATDAIGRIAQALGDGSLTVEQAMERLVDHALTGLDGRLTTTERTELLALLRDALADDPALGALRESLR